MSVVAACEPMLDGTAAKTCASFCDASFLQTHCGFCACATCTFCEPRYSSPAAASAVRNSTKAAACVCQDWCQAKNCASCKCSACSFCAAASSTKLPPPLPTAAQTPGIVGLALPPPPPRYEASPAPLGGTLCSSHQAADASEKACQAWCQQSKHCAFCKCQACQMCDHAPPALPPLPLASMAQPDAASQPTPATHSSDPTKPPTRDCSERCNAQKCSASKGSDCDTCACRGCAFCAALKPIDTAAAPSESAVPALHDCRWLESLRDLRGKQAWCRTLSNTDRLTCEANYITTSEEMLSQMRAYHVGGAASHWQRCLWRPSEDKQSTGECVGGLVFTCAPPGPPAPSRPPRPPHAPPSGVLPPTTTTSPPVAAVAADAASPPPSTTAKTASSSEGGCTPINAHDVSATGCLPWCNALASRTHCAYCACRSCHFCVPPSSHQQHDHHHHQEPQT